MSKGGKTTCPRCERYRWNCGRGLCWKCRKFVVATDQLEDYPRLNGTADHMLDDWADLRAQGYTWRHAAERMGIKPATLDRALARAKTRGDDRGCRSLTDLKAWRNQQKETA